jgi:hypothetical protein
MNDAACQFIGASIEDLLARRALESVDPLAIVAAFP